MRSTVILLRQLLHQLKDLPKAQELKSLKKRVAEGELIVGNASKTVHRDKRVVTITNFDTSFVNKGTTVRVISQRIRGQGDYQILCGLLGYVEWLDAGSVLVSGLMYVADKDF